MGSCPDPWIVAVNMVYLPLVEEPALARRFGDDYLRYMERVPRWLPRLGADGDRT